MDKDTVYRKSKLRPEIKELRDKLDKESVREFFQKDKLKKYGMTIVDGKITTVDKHLK